MNERTELRDLGEGIRRRLWIPVFFAIAGVVIGVIAALNVPIVYRSKATVLVGPTNGAVTHTSTIRTSEDLALFYADMARRQIVLDPVIDRLQLQTPWSILRNQVSAVVPTQNLRLVEVTVLGDSQQETDAIADEIVSQLVLMSPTLPGGNTQAFINEQVDRLKTAIEEAQARIVDLKAEMERSNAPRDSEQAIVLRRQLYRQQQLVGDWQKNYVDLIAAEPTSDAGGLQVIDEAAPVTDMGRAAAIRQGIITGFVGGVFGLLVAWLLYSRERRFQAGRPGGQEVKPSGPGAPRSPGAARRRDKDAKVPADKDDAVLAGTTQWVTPRTNTNGHAPAEGTKGQWR